MDDQPRDEMHLGEVAQEDEQSQEVAHSDQHFDLVMQTAQDGQEGAHSDQHDDLVMQTAQEGQEVAHSDQHYHLVMQTAQEGQEGPADQMDLTTIPQARQPRLSLPPGQATPAFLESRAGRKRKANSRYLDEPSPVAAPARRVSAPKKIAAKAPAPALPVEVALTEEIPPLITGPPTFGSILFGKSAPQSEDFSEDELLDDRLSLDDDQDDLGDYLGDLGAAVEGEEDVKAAELGESAKSFLDGSYVASGVAGPTIHGLIKPALVAPTSDFLAFPNLVPLEGAELHPTPFPVMAELACGGIRGLLPHRPIHWLRDEVPKLSAYFKKKMEGAAPAPKAELPVKHNQTEAAEREERRRQKEEERRRILEERQRRKERERLKQLYRQHWIALTKFPIEDSVLHSIKGVRRLGPPAVRTVAGALAHWDSRIGESVVDPGNFLLDEIFVIWTFFAQFPSLLGCRFTFPQLVEALVVKRASPLAEDVFRSLIDLLRPFIVFQLTTFLAAEQAFEAQLVRNRGRAKLFWPTFSQFRDFLHLGCSLFVQDGGALSKPRLDGAGSTNWVWLGTFVAKLIVLFESIDPKRDFLASVAAAFEEVDFEFHWLFQNDAVCFEKESVDVRVKTLRTLLDKLLSLNLFKRLVDLACEAKLHISSEILWLEKEERKSTQKIALCQKLIELGSADLPLSADELKLELASRESVQKAKKIANLFADSLLGVRVDVLGRDRILNEYFQTSFLRRVVFVRNASDGGYGAFDSLGSLETLIQSLDERGVREQALKVELQKVKANLYSDLLLEGEPDLAHKTAVDWLAPYERVGGRLVELFSTQTLSSLGTEVPNLSPLAQCVETSQLSLSMLKACWFGNKFRKIKKMKKGEVKGEVKSEVKDEPAIVVEDPVLEDDDDDVTVDEGMDQEEVDPPEEEEEEEDEESWADDAKGDPIPVFVSEPDSLFKTFEVLAETLSEGFARKCFGPPGKKSSESILVQFHVKSGQEFLRQVGIPTVRAEFDKLLNPLFQDVNQKQALAVTGGFLEGLAAIDEVVADELGVDVWPSGGGEKAAWRLFLGQREGESVGEESAGVFGCDLCGKNFGLHILLGLHKMKPCKTRGRKPIPTEPLMELDNSTGPYGGPAAIESLVLPSFPPPPSARTTTSNERPSTEDTSFVCDICGKVFPHNQGLAVHQTRWCIPEQQAQLLLTAQQAVNSASSVMCETCGKSFPSAAGLATHQTRWCKKEEEEEKKEIVDASVSIEPLFVSSPIDPSELARFKSSPNEEASSRQEPGSLPACYSLSAVSLAALWLTGRIAKATKK